MAGNKRSNKARNQTKNGHNASWFTQNKTRARKRTKQAKQARKRNRK